MRTWPRTWFAAAALLAVLGGGAAQAAGFVAPGDPAAVTGSDAAAALRPETGPGTAPGSLALARRVVGLQLDAERDDRVEPLAFSFGRGGARAPRVPRTPASRGALGGERARILLRSLTLPGWGQATLGRSRSAAFFGLTEAAIWGTFTAFRIQVAMRDAAASRAALLQAGIDLRRRDEEWRRIVGGFISSEEYNRLVVARDAANLFLADTLSRLSPSGQVVYNSAMADSYFTYIERHKLSGSDAWCWSSAEAQRTYRDLRKTAQRATQRANTALAVAVVNRIVSALHAARAAGHPARAAQSWRFEVVPVASTDATAFQFRVRARF
jgi:hypothetical protein